MLTYQHVSARHNTRLIGSRETQHAASLTRGAHSRNSSKFPRTIAITFFGVWGIYCDYPNARAFTRRGSHRCQRITLSGKPKRLDDSVSASERWRDGRSSDFSPVVSRLGLAP